MGLIIPLFRIYCKKNNNINTMEFLRASQTSRRGSRWHVTPRSMVAGTCSLQRECEFREVKSIMSQQRFNFTGHLAVTFTTDLRDRKWRKKLNMAEKITKKQEIEKHPEDHLYLDSTVFVISVKSLAKSGSDACYVTRPTLISLSLSPLSLGTELIKQIGLCRHTLLHPRQIRTSAFDTQPLHS